MTGSQVFLTDSELQMLHSMSQSTGKTENELLHEALDLLKVQVELESRQSLLRPARGMSARPRRPSFTEGLAK